jgi:type II secretory pathway pseudopilin PulG
MLVTVTVLALALGIGMPMFLSTVYRARLEGAARQMNATMQSARLKAIKLQRNLQVEMVTDEGRVVAFIDDDADKAQDLGEEGLPPIVLQQGLTFRAPAGQTAVEGFEVIGNRALAIFLSDGSVDAQGAIRIADERDNFLEVRVAPKGSAKIEVRKWDGANWWARNEGGHPWHWN